MTYNKFYTKIIEDYILDSANDYKYKYHIVITFPNVANTDDYISSVYEYLNNTSFFFLHGIVILIENIKKLQIIIQEKNIFI